MIRKMSFLWIAGFFAFWKATLCSGATDEVVRHPQFPRVKLSEDDRLEEYNKRNQTWPIEKFVPDNEGWTKLMKERLEQVEELEGLVSTVSGGADSCSPSLSHISHQCHGRDHVTKDSCRSYVPAF